MKDVGKYLKEVASSTEEIFNDPIKGFGTLSDYAAMKLSRMTSIGRDKLESHHKCFQHEADTIDRYSSAFAAAAEGLIRRHKKDIINKQLATKRLGDVVIDLFVSVCVLSRASKIVAEKGEENSKTVIDIAKVFIRNARRRMTGNIRGLDRNDDDKIESIADYVFEKKSYQWDLSLIHI